MDESFSDDIKTIEFNFNQKLEQPPLDCDELLRELDRARTIKAYNAEKMATALQEKLVAEKDIDGLIKVLAKKAEWNGDTPTFGLPLPQVFRKATSDRAFLRIVDSAKFGRIKPSESLRRLSVLRSLAVGKTYFDKTWGLGEVTRVDSFNSRVYIDFPGRPGHAMSFEYAAETLKIVPPTHLLAMAHRDPEGMAKKVAEKPGEVVKAAIESFGPSTVSRLQTLLLKYGIVPATIIKTDQDGKPVLDKDGKEIVLDGWKEFWGKARKALATDKLVNIPAKRSDPITIRKTELKYDDDWFRALKAMRSIPELFETISAYEHATSKPEVTPYAREVLTDRLMFAIKGAFLFPPPMFTRLVLMAQRLKIDTPRDKLVEALLDDDRFLMAGDKLSVGEAGEMVRFIVDARPEAVGILLEHLPDMGYTLLKQTMAVLRQIDEFLAPLQDRTRELLSSTSAPYTLVVWALRENKWEDLKAWRLPSLYELLDHGIAICEDQAATGEQLHMQHYIRDLFIRDYIRADARKAAQKANAKGKPETKAEDEGEAKAKDEGEAKTASETKHWFDKAFRQLTPLQQEALFMRLQSNAAIAEPRFQRELVKTMTAINEDLASKRISTFAPKAKAPEVHYSSWRSISQRQEEFRHLVDVEIPENTAAISAARAYGDLRENSEYQYARDQERILNARREEWRVELEKMRGTSFTDLPINYSAVGMGTTVTLRKADDSTVSYAILGEWDTDEAMGILSCLSRLGKLFIGKKVGDKVEIPAVNGTTEEVVVQAISPLSPAVLEWAGQPIAENA